MNRLFEPLERNIAQLITFFLLLVSLGSCLFGLLALATPSIGELTDVTTGEPITASMTTFAGLCLLSVAVMVGVTSLGFAFFSIYKTDGAKAFNSHIDNMRDFIWLQYKTQIDQLVSSSSNPLNDERLHQEITIHTKQVLPLLNGAEKGKLVRYLQECDLLSFVDLNGADLSGADLVAIDLSNVRLDGSDLSRANLRQANLTGSQITREQLQSAKVFEDAIVDILRE